MEIKEHNINGKKVFIIDNILNEQEIHSVYSQVCETTYTQTQMSDGLNHIPNLRFTHHIAVEEAPLYTPIFVAQKKILKKLELWKKQSTADVYVNVADAMTTTLPHCDRPEGCWTLLYFANFDWRKEYCGSTNFFTDDEIVLSCIPKPGRFVLFPSELLHQATPPTFYSPYKRYTIAFKMDRVTKAMRREAKEERKAQKAREIELKEALDGKPNSGFEEFNTCR